MNRRQFSAAMAAVGLSSAAPGQRSPEVERFRLSRNGDMPNNARLPVLLYHHAFNPATEELTVRMEQTFASTGWPAQWRNGVYPFHHFHSTAHEVLGFAAGSATLVLGGEGGHLLELHAGDVLVLPTGTGHCLHHASPGFLVVGAYPAGQHWDVCRSAPDVPTQHRIDTLPFPFTDPVHGPGGPLVRAWTQPSRD